MADKKVRIGIETTADTAGIDKTTGSLDDLQDKASRVARDGLEPMRDKVRVSEFGFYNLDEEIRKTNKTTESFTAGATKVETGSKNAGNALLLFSQGFEDAQYGIRGVLNNIPSLIIAMGGTAGVAGAVSVAAVSFSMLFEWMGRTGERAAEVKERISELAKATGDLETQKLTQLGDTIKARTDATIDLRADLTKVTQADNFATTSLLDNAQKITLAQLTIASAMGRRVDVYTEIQEKEQLLEKAREEATRQRIAEERKAVEKERTDLADAAKRQAAEMERAAIQRQRLNEARSARSIFAAEEERLKAEAEGPKVISPFAKGLSFMQRVDAFFNDRLTDGTLANDNVSERVGKAKAARGRLESPDFQQEKSSLEAKVDAIAKGLADFVAPSTGRIAQAAQEVQKQGMELQTAVDAAEKNIATLSENLKVDNLTGKAEELKGLTSALGESLQTAKTEIERVAAEQGGELSATAKNALVQLSEILKDGIVDEREIQKVGQVMALINASTERFNSTVLNGLSNQVAKMEAAIKQIEDLDKRLKKVGL